MTDSEIPEALSLIADCVSVDPARPALEVDGEVWSYGTLWAAVSRLAERLPSRAGGAGQHRIAVMAHRHASSYIGILATRLAGHTYVPINVTHPVLRSAEMLRASGASTILCGDLASDRLDAILAVIPDLADHVALIAYGDRIADHERSYSGQLTTRSSSRPGDLAYILFTSGSTGKPKGVPIPTRNLEAYLSAVRELLPAGPGDRFSQTFDLTFDLSVHDLFVSLTRGATLVIASLADLRSPAAYIRERGITHWFSVPSLAFQMRLQHQLSPGAFPGLRSTLFCGELLPSLLARDWQAAAPNSVVENWYGPTEATIACARHVLGAAPASTKDVPIGTAFPGMVLHVLDASLTPVAPNVRGELFLSGRQLARSYLDDEARTSSAFVPLPDGTRAYRTGDRAMIQTDGAVHFLGRTDSQLKVRGFRVELGEIESVLREVAGGANTMAMSWPLDDPSPSGILAAVEDGTANPLTLREALRDRLPDYMIPAEVIALNAFPRNASGKTDRRGVAKAIAALKVDTSCPRLGHGSTAERLLEEILRIAPALSRGRVVAADNLLDAGMDSLAFVAFTMELEKTFDLALDQEEVVRLSRLSFDAILREVEGRAVPRVRVDLFLGSLGQRLVAFLRRRRRVSHTRANRVVQFLSRLPQLLDQPGHPFVPVVGSSGVMRALSPAVFDEQSAYLGRRIRSINAGLPAVDPAGLRQVCEFMSSVARERGLRFPLAIWEFDPMHVSTTPPSGDIALTRDFFRRHIEPRATSTTAAEFDWRIESRGAWNPADASLAKARRPNWARKRDHLIARAYQGALEIDEARLSEWFAGAEALLSVSDRLVCFVHPADIAMLTEVEVRQLPDRLADTLEHIADRLQIEVLRWWDFDLGSADFLDINHVNAVTGRDKVTRQLAERVWR